jgi:hypothetical protein
MITEEFTSPRHSEGGDIEQYMRPDPNAASSNNYTKNRLELYAASLFLVPFGYRLSFNS